MAKTGRKLDFEQVLRSAQAPPAKAPTTYKSPFRQPSPASDWGTPLLQAATIALLAALLMGGACWSQSGSWLMGLKVGASTFLLVALVVFVLMVNRTHSSLFHTMEEKPPSDHGSDDMRPIVHSSQGKWEAPQAAPATVEDSAESACPYKEKSMKWFVWWAAQEGTGYDIWEKSLGRKRYVNFRNGLLGAGWADWNSYGAGGEPNVRQGWFLTAPDEEICKHINQ